MWNLAISVNLLQIYLCYSTSFELIVKSECTKLLIVRERSLKMTRKCRVCDKMDTNPHVSFHRFPLKPEIRNVWVSILGLEGCHLPNQSFLCSDHFDPQDIVVKNGVRYVKPGTVPVIPSSVLQSSPSSRTSSGSSKREFPITEGQEKCAYEINYDLPQYCSLDNLSSATTSKQLVSGDPNSFSSSSTVSSAFPGENSQGKTDVRTPSDSTKRAASEIGNTTSSTLSASETELIMDILDGKNSSNELCSTNLGKPVPERPRKRKIRYIGDMSSSDFSTPKKRKANLQRVKQTISKQRQKIHNLQMRVRRQKLKISSMKGLLKYLKDQALITETSESVIQASVSGTTADIFERMLKGPTRGKYNPALRSFALTLAFYSPKAYNFVRSTFNNTLPHLGTISRWYRSINGGPGFTKEALAALSSRQKELSRPLLCNLVMDEMSIRRQVEWNGKKFTGFVDIGTNLDSDVLPEAREALVFMAVCLNASWKVPVGYFLINGLSAQEKAELVKKCLEILHESGVTITSLTFDGAPVNFTMAEILGADLSNPRNLKSYFKHPVTQSDVYIFLDACHMIKLVRNCFASQDGLRDDKNRPISWEFIEKLVDMQKVEGLHAATKVRLRHIHWEREKMKVRLATQTISKSVSDAISFLRQDLNLENFQGSEGTSDFLLIFNNLFDILNSRNRFSKYFFKKPMSPGTSDTLFQYMENVRKYILDLTLKGKSVCNSSRKTGFLGFLICIESIKKMYKVHITENKDLMYILTYKLSQDHLELFFGAIRSRGGYNNNPTARQFEASYKRLLIHSEISGPNTGNAVNLEHVTILTCGSGKAILTTEAGDNLEESNDYQLYLQKLRNEIENQHFLTSDAWHLTVYANDIVAYIGGFVVRSLKKCVSCSKCISFLENDVSLSHLQKRKKYGQLIIASNMVITVCRSAEKYFQFFNKTENIFNRKNVNLTEILIKTTIGTLPSSVYDSFGDHLFDGDLFESHSVHLINLILKNYFNIRIHYETVKKLDLSRSFRYRSINTKAILFRNE